MKSTDKRIDKRLVLRCKDGESSAYALLVERWHQKMCRQAYFYTNDVDLSKDIAQDSWTVIFTKLDQLKAPENFGSWALSIVNRKAIDALRKHSRIADKLRLYKEGDLSIDQTEEIKMESRETDASAGVLKAIKKLPRAQQQVIRLFYVEQYNLSEIGDLLSVSKGTVKSRLFYAREKLKEIIKK